MTKDFEDLASRKMAKEMLKGMEGPGVMGGFLLSVVTVVVFITVPFNKELFWPIIGLLVLYMASFFFSNTLKGTKKGVLLSLVLWFAMVIGLFVYVKEPKDIFWGILGGFALQMLYVLIFIIYRLLIWKTPDTDDKIIEVKFKDIK